MNILDKFKDDDLIKLSTQNIPFISSGSKSKLAVRNMKFKVTNVTVPGLEGMAEESDKKLPKDLEDLDKKSKEIEKKFRDSLKVPTKNEEVEESFKDNIIKKLVKPIKDYNKKKEEPKKEEVKEPTGNLKDACWTGYVAVGTKMKNGKRVPNCVPKSEAYKGAKAIVENAFKKLKEKK